MQLSRALPRSFTGTRESHRRGVGLWIPGLSHSMSRDPRVYWAEIKEAQGNAGTRMTRVRFGMTPFSQATW